MSTNWNLFVWFDDDFVFHFPLWWQSIRKICPKHVLELNYNLIRLLIVNIRIRGLEYSGQLMYMEDASFFIALHFLEYFNEIVVIPFLCEAPFRFSNSFVTSIATDLV